MLRVDEEEVEVEWNALATAAGLRDSNKGRGMLVVEPVPVRRWDNGTERIVGVATYGGIRAGG